MSDTNCPYCETSVEIDVFDIGEHPEGKLYDKECRSCGKIFCFDVIINFSHNSYKAPCLNGGNHAWAAIRWYDISTNVHHVNECRFCGVRENIKDGT